MDRIPELRPVTHPRMATRAVSRLYRISREFQHVLTAGERTVPESSGGLQDIARCDQKETLY